jgi:large subunit ribosomal protein L35
LRKEGTASYQSRLFTTSSPIKNNDVVESTTSTTSISIDPNTVFTAKGEKELASLGKTPIGSRRRRAALASSPGIPFEQLPYQCFQEALKIVAEERAETVKKLEHELEKIGRMQKLVDEGGPNTAKRQAKIRDMTKYVNDLTIQADIHDPRIKTSLPIFFHP